MKDNEFEAWLDDNLEKYTVLTQAAEATTRSLLSVSNIPHLTVTSRTKDRPSCLEKKKRKNYTNASRQMTDISGVRIIVHFEHELAAVSELINSAFNVDQKNSSNKDDLLSVHELGYRSLHYVCDLGEARVKLPEFAALRGLKFEFQVRTVVQHAWAELAHDRNYKFQGKLPKEIERKLYLLSGMLEIADSGFSELSARIDEYAASVAHSTSTGELDIEITTVSLIEFVQNWGRTAEKHMEIIDTSPKNGYSDLISELKDLDITNLKQLKDIIPNGFAEKFLSNSATIYGVVRDWMILSGPERFVEKVDFNWALGSEDIDLYREFLSDNQIELLRNKLGQYDSDADYDWENEEE